MSLRIKNCIRLQWRHRGRDLAPRTSLPLSGFSRAVALGSRALLSRAPPATKMKPNEFSFGHRSRADRHTSGRRPNRSETKHELSLASTFGPLQSSCRLIRHELATAPFLVQRYAFCAGRQWAAGSEPSASFVVPLSSAYTHLNQYCIQTARISPGN